MLRFMGSQRVGEKIIANEATDKQLISKIYNGEKIVTSISGAGKNE